MDAKVDVSGDVKRFMVEANLIGGEWVGADAGETIEVDNPATGEIIGTVPKAGAAETRRAIEAAHEAWQPFAAMTAKERADILRRMADVMMDNQQALGELLTLEMGKPLAEAKGEIAIGAQYLLWFAEEARRVYGDLVPSPFPGRRIMVRKESCGVVAAITPWNFPSSMLARKIGPAIAAGCPSVIKPASQTPYSGLAWGVIAQEAGLPDGVMNIVTGSASAIGKEICENDLVRKLTFTGSTDVGKILLKQAAQTVKKVSMELGGNAPFLVFDGCDVDAAVEGAMAAKFRNSGQTCVCTNRFYVQAGVYDEFTSKLAKATGELKVGPGLREGTQQGPLIDGKALEKVEELVADALRKGAEVVTGAERSEEGDNFYKPTVPQGRDAGHALRQGGDLRPRRARLQGGERGGGHPPRQRHRVWPRLLLLQPGPRADLPRHGEPAIRLGRRERRRHHHARGAVRRRQGVGARLRGRPPGHRGISRDEVCVYRWAGPLDHERRTSPGRVPQAARR